MDRIKVNDLLNLINTLADDMTAKKDELNTLDGAIGDGDLGITMTLGFQEIKKQLSCNHYADLQSILSDCGMAFADNAASTFGALMATMFTRAAQAVKDKTAIGAEEGAAILLSASEGVQKRGHANLGDKTILDALIPASEAYSKALSANQTLPRCLAAALTAARNGSEQTVKMLSKIGRAGWLGERTIGAKDPGAAAFVMLLESITNFVSGSK
jgi:dihydroxyacetone kinase phosphoprotein-dependent L subunit